MAEQQGNHVCLVVQEAVIGITHQVIAVIHHTETAFGFICLVTDVEGIQSPCFFQCFHSQLPEEGLALLFRFFQCHQLAEETGRIRNLFQAAVHDGFLEQAFI